MDHIQTQQLKRIRLFEPLPAASLARLGGIASVRRLEAGDVLFTEGSVPQSVQAILEGSAVLISKGCAEESVVEFLGPGDSILLPSILLGAPYPVSARMCSAGLVLELPAQAFVRLVAADTALAQHCAQSVSRQWGVLLAQVKQIKTQGAAERLAHFLLSQVSATMGPASLTLPGMKKQVATRLGIKPETLSRTLRKLRAFGVEAHGDLIRIRSIERLQSLLAHEQAGRA